MFYDILQKLSFQTGMFFFLCTEPIQILQFRVIFTSQRMWTPSIDKLMKDIFVSVFVFYSRKMSTHSKVWALSALIVRPFTGNNVISINELCIAN